MGEENDVVLDFSFWSRAMRDDCKLVEVGCSSRFIQGEIVAVRVGAGSHSRQARSPIRCDVDRLRDDSVRLHDATPIVTHGP
jgi:hypothetical protein